MVQSHRQSEKSDPAEKDGLESDGLADRATHLDGSTHLSRKRDQIKMRDYMDGRVTSPTWGPPPPCKEALSFTAFRQR